MTDLLLASSSLSSSPPEMKDAVAALMAENPTAAAGEMTLSGNFQGTWEVSSKARKSADGSAQPRACYLLVSSAQAVLALEACKTP